MAFAQSTKLSINDATWRFLIQCLKSRWDVSALGAARQIASRRDIDWDGLYREAQVGGVPSILYDIVRDKELVPPRIEEELKLTYYVTARQNLVRLHHLDQVIGRLNEQSIPGIFLKGATLAETVYGNIALRPMVDVDILVRDQDLMRVLDALDSLGYQRDKNQSFSALNDVHANEITVRKPGIRESAIEIHWSLFWFPYYQQTVPMCWFWESRRPITLREMPAFALGLEAQIIHACGHLLHHQAAGDEYRLLWLYDIASLIARYHREIDWDLVLTYGLRFNLVLAIRPVLLTIHKLLEPPIPQSVLDEIRDLQPTDTELRVHAWLQKIGPSFKAYAAASIMSYPDLASRIRFIWRALLFPSRNFMRNRYQIKHPVLTPFYYPYRWIEGLARAIRFLF